VDTKTAQEGGSQTKIEVGKLTSGPIMRVGQTDDQNMQTLLGWVGEGVVVELQTD
jgi:hypothetical protein